MTGRGGFIERGVARVARPARGASSAAFWTECVGNPVAWIVLLAVLAAVSGCATVRPYQRERLVDPIVSFQKDAKADARKTKTWDAREGSTGGNGGAGGGCACN